jgi:hypothetical protein
MAALARESLQGIPEIVGAALNRDSSSSHRGIKPLLQAIPAEANFEVLHQIKKIFVHRLLN